MIVVIIRMSRNKEKVTETDAESHRHKDRQADRRTFSLTDR